MTDLAKIAEWEKLALDLPRWKSTAGNEDFHAAAIALREACAELRNLSREENALRGAYSATLERKEAAEQRVKGLQTLLGLADADVHKMSEAVSKIVAQRDANKQELTESEKERKIEFIRAEHAESRCAMYRQQIDSLFIAIEHGDADHRAWLKTKLKEHFSPKDPVAESISERLAAAEQRVRELEEKSVWVDHWMARYQVVDKRAEKAEACCAVYRKQLEECAYNLSGSSIGARANEILANPDHAAEALLARLKAAEDLAKSFGATPLPDASEAKRWFYESGAPLYAAWRKAEAR